MKKELLIIVLLFLAIPAAAQERTFKFWNSNSVEVKIGERLSAGVNEKIQYLPREGTVNHKLGDLFVKRKFTRWLDVGVAGRLGLARDEDQWKQEIRPMVFGNLSAGLGLLEFEFSNRMEYRVFKEIEDYFRHRQMLTVEIPPVNSLTWIKMFIAEESFYRFDEQQVHLARLQTGTKIRYSNNFEMKIFYILEKTRTLSHWNTSDILGLNLNVDF